MRQNLYPKTMPFDNGAQDYVVDETMRGHLNAIQHICEQCRDREVFADELEPHLTALGEGRESVRRLGERLLRCLKIEIQTLRYHDVMWCVERIKCQFGE